MSTVEVDITTHDSMILENEHSYTYTPFFSSTEKVNKLVEILQVAKQSSIDINWGHDIDEYIKDLNELVDNKGLLEDV